MKLEFEWIAKRLEKQPACTVLDVGAGRSENSTDSNDLVKWLLNHSHKVIGNDLKAVTYTHPNFTFFQGSFLDNKLQDEQFDLVVSVSTLHHIGKPYSISVPEEKIQQEDMKGPSKTLSEISRVLKMEGDFFLSVVIRPSSSRKDTWDWCREDVLALVDPCFKVIEEEVLGDLHYTYFLLHLKKKGN